MGSQQNPDNLQVSNTTANLSLMEGDFLEF